jgi:hypothetical protein
MLALLLVAVALLLISIVGESLEARSRRRLCSAERIVDPARSALPEPLIPSTIQRSSGGG